jgi:hypothetical protein
VRNSIAPEAAGSSAAPAAENRPADLAAARKVAVTAHRCLAAAGRKPAASAGASRAVRSAPPDPAQADRETSGESRHKTAETNRPYFAQARALAPPVRKPAGPAVVRKPAEQVGARKPAGPAAVRKSADQVEARKPAGPVAERRPAGRPQSPDSSAAARRPSDWRADWSTRTRAATTNSRRRSARSPAPR